MNNSSAALDRIFHALAHPARRRMLRDLSRGEKSVGRVAAAHRVSLNTVSRHLSVLRAARLIEQRRDGRTHYCRLNADRLREVDEWMQYYREFWTLQLDGLERLFPERKR
jgi:DNA-binding transcriptional ArsR family regulator